MELTLNDFRNVLGKVNDGDVVFKNAEGGVDKTGIEKANAGNFFTSRRYRRVTYGDNSTVAGVYDRALNREMRVKFLTAILNSDEAKALTDATKSEIMQLLGVGGVVTDAKLLRTPLSRRTVKAIVELVDRDATAENLINVEIAAAEAKGILNKAAADELRGGALAFRVDGDEASYREMFGEDFRGNSPAAIRKFVMQNKSVVREHLFDRMYFLSHRVGYSLGQELFYDKPDDDAFKKAFRAVVEDLMKPQPFGKGLPTRMSMYAGSPVEQPALPNGGYDVFNGIAQGRELEKKIDNVIGRDGQPDDTGTFADLQSRFVASALKASIRTTFNRIYIEQRYNPQQTEAAFKTATKEFSSLLDSLSKDFARIADMDARRKVFEKVMSEFGRLIADGKVFLGKPDQVKAKFMAVLDSCTKHFALRSLAVDYVNANHKFAENKQKMVDYIVSRVERGVVKEDANAVPRERQGVDDNQRTALGEHQRTAALSGKAVDTAELNADVFDRLAADFQAKAKAENPEAVRAARMKRNLAVATKIARAQNENRSIKFDDMPPAGKNRAILDAKASILISKIGYARSYALGITKKNELELMDGDEALNRLDEELCKMDDREFDFYVQYFEKKGLETDVAISNEYAIAFNRPEHNSTPIRDALLDGVMSIDDVPGTGFKLLGRIFSAGMTGASGDADAKTDLYDLWSGCGGKMLNSDALYYRLHDSIAAVGLDKGPPELHAFSMSRAEWEKRGKPEDMHQRALQGKRGDDGFQYFYGFGTTDIAKILKTFKDCGISLKGLEGKGPAGAAEVAERIISLSLLAKAAGFNLDGLSELCQRLTGKAFKDASFGEIVKALLDKKALATGVLNGRTYVIVPDQSDGLKDPLNALKGTSRNIVDFLCGRKKLDETGLEAKDIAVLLNAARRLDRGKTGDTESVALNGVNVEFVRLSGGELRAKINGLPFRPTLGASGLRFAAEDAIVSNADRYDADVVKSAFPSEPGKDGVSLMRSRELYAKAAASKTGTLTVMFSSYSVEELAGIASRALEGKFTAKDIEPPRNTYNSQAMIEMHDRLGKAPKADIDAVVQIPSPELKDFKTRQENAPEKKDVHNLVADLFMNKDTWDFDAAAAGKSRPGERIAKILVEYGPELKHILADQDRALLETLPESVRAEAKAIFGLIAAIDVAALADPAKMTEDVRGRLAEVENRVAAATDTIINTMQQKVIDLFKPHDALVEKPLWQKSLGEMAGKNGIDMNTKTGRFTMMVLENYFKNSAVVDKRAMLAAFIRNTDSASSESKQVAELLKGAGPLLQKMLQGLPLSSFDPDTQLALKDMKSRLLPIPDEAIKAQLYDLVKSSGGEILSIEVKRSLGAASVGQALLCTIRTKAHPNVGEECVVKLLRPNVETAIRRERDLVEKLIKDNPAQQAAFGGQYKKILEEFDLTHESKHIAVGEKIYEKPAGEQTVHSMSMLAGVNPTMTAIIVRKAEGTTYDSLVRDIRDEAEQMLEDAGMVQKSRIAPNGPEKTVYKASDVMSMILMRRRLLEKCARLGQSRNHILDVAKAWFYEALFGDGFFHGDLHAGNVMADPQGATFIDFGNCSRFSKEQQTDVGMMLACCCSGDFDKMAEHFRKMLPEDARTQFDAVFFANTPESAAARDELKAAASRGIAHDMMERLQAFVGLVQAKDVAVPPELTNFISSFVRLNEIVADIDDAIAEIDAKAHSLYVDSDKYKGPADQPVCFKKIEDAVRAFIGGPNAPCNDGALEALDDDIVNYVSSDEGMAEINDIVSTNDNVIKYVKPFAERFKDMSCLCPGGNINMQSTNVLIRTFLTDSITKIEEIMADAAKLEEGEAKQELLAEAAKVRKRIKEQILILLGVGEQDESIARRFLSSMSMTMPDEDHDDVLISSFRGIAMQRPGDVMQEAAKVIMKNAYAHLGTAVLIDFKIDAGGFAQRVLNADEASDKFKTKITDTARRLAKRNFARPEQERLSAAEQRAIAKEMRDFRVQTPPPWADDGWAQKEAKRAAFLDAIAYNLSLVRNALGLDGAALLSKARVEHAMHTAAALHPELGQAVAGLSDADYAALYAAAQVSKDPALAEALTALRTSGNMV